MTVLGKIIRMKRLFNAASEKTLVVAMDHAIAWGVLPGIERIDETIKTVVQAQPDAVILSKGIAENCFSKHAGRVSLAIKLDSWTPFQPDFETKLGEIDEAVRLGADAVSIGVTIGSAKQADLLTRLAKFTREAELVGMPVMAHIYPRGSRIKASEKYEAKTVAYTARVATEMGVEIIKTWYTGSPESFAKVIEAAVPGKVIVSGGTKLANILEIFQTTRDAIDAGAKGVAYGRNVWQCENPIKMIWLLKKVVHEGLSADKAIEMWKKKQPDIALTKGSLGRTGQLRL